MGGGNTFEQSPLRNLFANCTGSSVIDPSSVVRSSSGLPLKLLHKQSTCCIEKKLMVLRCENQRQRFVNQEQSILFPSEEKYLFPTIQDKNI